jgi:PKD repeat protein
MKKIMIMALCVLLMCLSGEAEKRVFAETDCGSPPPPALDQIRTEDSVGTGSALAPPVAAFDFQAKGLQVSFQDHSSGEVEAWYWHFSDGCGSNKQHPSHRFTAPGVYTVILRVTNSAGSDTLERKISVAHFYWMPMIYGH